MSTIFNLLAIFYVFRSVQIGLVVWRSWRVLQGDTFSSKQKSLAEQASFFLAVPVAVFFHELSHALAVWAFGGQVVEFGYRFFWGFVVPEGNFSAAEDWFIALAGTLGSLIFGLFLWLIFRRSSSPTFRYFGLRSFRYQIFFSLVYYPVFTLLGFYGDWRTIYDFNATPVLSGGTAAIHVFLLGLFIWVDRKGYFQMASFESLAEREKVSALETQTAISPYDTKSQLDLIDAYRRGGETKKAEGLLKQFLHENPNSAEGFLELAALNSQGKGQIPRSARDNAAKALNLGLSNPAGVAYANQLQGEYSLGVDKLDEAIGYFGRGIDAAQKADRPSVTAHLNYLRAVTYRRAKKYEPAYQDIKQAILIAQAAGLEKATAQYKSELETIELHAGRSFSANG